MARLRARPHSVQRRFLEDPSRIRAFVGGIGSGKTWAGAIEIVRQPAGTRCMVVAPTYRVLKDATMPAFFDECRPLIREHRKADMATVLINGTQILWRTATEPDRLRGPNLGFIWIDEAAMLKDAVPFEILVGRLRLSPGRMILTTTPKGFNWLYKLKTDKQATFFHASTKDNRALPPDFFSFVSDRYTSELARQELAGEFVDLSGGMFKRQWFKKATTTPSGATNRFRFWDLAVSTRQAADYTATARVTIDHDGAVVIDGIWQGKAAWPDIKRRIISTALEEPDTVVGIETIAGFEVAYAELLQERALAGIAIRSVKPARDKATRAAPLAVRAEAGKVYVVPGAHSEAFIDQAVSFPHDSHDDLVDAASGALGLTIGQVGQRIVTGKGSYLNRREMQW